MGKKFFRRNYITLNSEIERIPIPIVSTAAVATVKRADGRLMPLLIVDTSRRPDIEDMIKAHRQSYPGDVDSRWSLSFKNKQAVHLWLIFKRPSRCIANLEFDVIKLGGVVDQIVSAEALLLQCGKEGDSLLGTVERDRIVVEVPSKSFRKEWDKILHKALEKDARRTKGLDKQKAKEYASGIVQEWRRFIEMRMRRD